MSEFRFLWETGGGNINIVGYYKVIDETWDSKLFFREKARFLFFFSFCLKNHVSHCHISYLLF